MSVKGSLGRVLVVDDDPALRRAVRRQLEVEGWSTVEAGSVPEALAAMREGQELFDCVVSDIQMPPATGFDLIEQIRKHDDELPVLLMTGEPTFDGAVRAIDTGAVSYLSKPFTQDTLASAVGKAARRHGLARMRRRAAVFADQVLSPEGTELSARLDRALARLWMAFQPIVDVSQGTVFAYEALLRTDEPTLKHPDVLLGAAERLGRIHDVGRAVRAAISRELDHAPADALLLVNVHGLELLDPELYAATNPLSPHARRIVIEITERIGLDAFAGATRVKELRDLGYQIAVDDLGAGYAALGALASLEPEIVKLDMSLVRDLERRPTLRRIVQAMATLVRELGGRVIAEGVETPAERDAVIACGVTLLQGWLFARPEPGFRKPTL